MWGGFALAELRPEDRPHPLHINENDEALFRAAQSSMMAFNAAQSSMMAFNKVSRFLKRGIRKVGRMAGF
jgi:hypothetical protein